MEFQRPLCLFFLLFITLLSSSQATKFNVVGDGSWTPNPSENYNQWSGRNRFQINDSLVFKYQKGTDSVLQVTKDDYDKCNKTNPLKKFDNGNTEFPLDRPGAFYFISGQDGNCEKGQKLLVVVITPRGNTKPVSPAPTTAPIPSPPSPPSVSPSVTPSPAVKPPTSSPPTPAATSPSPSPAVSTPPAAGGPVATPATSPAVSTPPAAGGPVATPATSPSMSPEVSTPPSAGGPPAPSPMGTSPAGAPGGLSPSGTSGSANAPGTNGAAPPPANSAPSVTPSGFLVLSVTPSGFLVLSVTIVVGALFMR